MSTTSATPDTIPTTSTDRRVAPRRQPAMGTICRLETEDTGPMALALVWNISATGISLLVPDPRAHGALVTGYLEQMEGDHMMRFAARVVHMKKLETGDYFVGAHFEQRLTADELKPFVAE